MSENQLWDYEHQNNDNDQSITSLQDPKNDLPQVDYATVTFDGTEDRGRKRRRGTRWGVGTDMVTPSTLSQIPKYIPGGMTMEQQEAMLVRVRIEEITKKVVLNDFKFELERSVERSPSPEPIYDNQGKRTNTRDQRVKDRVLLERQTLIQTATLMHPTFKPPADYVPISTKKQRKIPIPQAKHPEYNFIGLIIGPRGNTQKKMERETGCKIVIRGRGSVKDGKGKKGPQPGDDEPLHVLVTGDSEVAVDRAAKMISDLLVPMDETKNEHKRQQLRELAEINGTLRDRAWMNAEPQSFTRADVKCGICGDKSHPTSDCPMRGTAGVIPQQHQHIKDEYSKFLEEIGETQESKDSTDSAYQQFMEEIGEAPNNTTVSGDSTPNSAGVPPWQGAYQGGYGMPAPWMGMGMPGMPMGMPGANPWANMGGAPSGNAMVWPGMPPFVPGMMQPWQQQQQPQ